MKNPAKSVSMLMLTVLVIGCSSMSGRWTSQNFKPEVARQEFNFLGTALVAKDFTGTEVILRDDETYTTYVYYGDEVIVTRGTWKKTEDKITFVDNRGEAYTYHYERHGDDMYIYKMVQGTKVKLTLERE